MIAVQIFIVVFLILLNGFFAMAEMAIVSSRRSRLQQFARDRKPGASVALGLARDPSRFLSAVQIGITLIGILAGAFSGTTLAEKLAARLKDFPFLGPYAETLSIALVVIAITYISLIVGELVPKHLALRNAEAVAARVARPIAFMTRMGAPLIWMLNVSTNAVMRVLGLQHQTGKGVTEEEIRLLIAEGTEGGAIHVEERRMIEGVLRLADRSVRSIMTPRPEVHWIDSDQDADAIRRKVKESDFSRLIVSRGQIDNVIGHVRKKDLLDLCLDGKPLDVVSVLRQPLVLPEQTSILAAIERFKKVAVHIAVVVDEYGSLEGIVTQTDILEAIAGDLADRETESDPPVIRRDDGSWLLDGALDIDTAKEILALPTLPDEGDYHTLAGFILAQLRRVPAAGDHLSWGDWRFEVVDMDGRRIDKVLAIREEQGSSDVT